METVYVPEFSADGGLVPPTLKENVNAGPASKKDPVDPQGLVIVNVLADVDTAHDPEANAPERTHAELVKRGRSAGNVMTISDVVFS